MFIFFFFFFCGHAPTVYYCNLHLHHLVFSPLLYYRDQSCFHNNFMPFRNGFSLIYNTRYYLTQKSLQKCNVSSTHAKSHTVIVKIGCFEEINNSTIRIYSTIIDIIQTLQSIFVFKIFFAFLLLKVLVTSPVTVLTAQWENFSVKGGNLMQFYIGKNVYIPRRRGGG